MSIDAADEALASLKQKRDLILQGKTLSTDIQQAITDAQVTRTVVGAPTLTLNVTDPHKILLRSNIFGHEVMVRLLPFTYEVVQVSKVGTALTITCEDQTVATLRKNNKPFRVDAGKMTHVDFARMLVRQDAKWIKFKTATGGVPVIKSKTELTRGDPTNKSAPKESTWDAINREAQKRGWRVFARGVDELWYVPDKYLFGTAPTYLLQEGKNGVDNIDFDYDEGKHVAQMTVQCRSSLWQIPPGNIAQVKDLGPGNGKWLIQDINRRLKSLTTQVTLVQPQPVLPEPQPSGGISLADLSGLNIPGLGAGGSSTASAHGLTFDQLAALAKNAGFSDTLAPIMAAIAMAESSGVPTELNNNPSTGDYSFGLWQINMIGSMGPDRAKEFGIITYDQLFDPATNARAAYRIYKDQGLNAWSTYKSGAYLRYYPGIPDAAVGKI